MNIPPTPAFAFAGLHSRRIDAESVTVPTAKPCALGFVSCNLAEATFRIEAFAVHPSTPTDLRPPELALWLLDRPGGPSYLLGWAIQSTMLEGLVQLLQSAPPLTTFDVIRRIGEWSSIGRSELAPPDGEGFDVASVWDATDFEWSPLDVLELGEGREAQHQARLRDMVATQAVMRWTAWADGPGECPHLCGQALQALADWRSANAPT